MSARNFWIDNINPKLQISDHIEGTFDHENAKICKLFAKGGVVFLISFDCNPLSSCFFQSLL